MSRNGDRATLALMVLSLSGAVLTAQPYAETQRITLIDLPVELRSAKDPNAAAEQPPRGLATDDFEVRVDGQRRELVAFARLDEAGPRPYQILIYLDPELSDSREVQGSLDLLVSMTRQLTDLAAVDLVVADPVPRFVLRDVGDPELLEQALLSQEWKESAADQLRGLRAGFLEAVDRESDYDRVELEVAFIREEVRLVQERADLLLSFLAQHAAAGKTRALLLAGLQFDLDPGDFYSSSTSREHPPSPGLDRATRDLAASLGADGWVTFPIAAPEPQSPLIPGKRIGKWRIAGPAGDRVIGLRIARESERNPERARAHLENAQALLERGSAVEAEGAFRDALHYFYGDPRTAEEQAEALVGLAAAVEAQGRTGEARGHRRLAADLDASVVEESTDSLAILLDPLAGLGELAVETSGRVVHERADLATALLGLRRRVRLSLQFEGEPLGELYEIEVETTRPGWSARAPRWARFGSPETVAAARMRLFLGSGEVEAPLDLEVRLDRDPLQESATIELKLGVGEPVVGEDRYGDLEVESRCRLTQATGSAEEGSLRLEHHAIVCRRSELALTASAHLSMEADYVAVLLEHLASGDWGTAVVEIPSP